MTLLLARATAVRFLSLGVLWWILAEGSWYGWPYALIIVLLATALSIRTLPPRRRRVGVMRRSVALVRLAGYFVARSAAGGVDVARRALRRTVDIDPGMMTYDLRLPRGPDRVVVVLMTNLMPGTLCTELDDHVVQVHVLDPRLPATKQLARLEQVVGQVSGWRPDDGNGH